MDIAGLKKALDKRPKSLLFARLSDALRLGTGVGQKNEALAVVNKGLEINSGFLPGRLARGRILFENGDFAGAKADFEAVAEQDPFCLSAQKLLLETLVVLEQQPKTGIYTKILNAIEPKVKVETNAQEIRKTVSAASAAPDSQSVFDALDSILNEEDIKNETEISSLLMQTFDNVIGKELDKKPVAAPKAEPSAPVAVPAVAAATATVAASAPPAEKLVAEKAPDLTKELDSLLEDEGTPPTDTAAAASEPPAAEPAAEEPAKEVAVAEPVAEEPAKEAAAEEPAKEVAAEEPAAETAAPNIDDLVAEQLKPKENLPDLTKELDTLMTDEGIPPEEDTAAAKAPPSIDDLVAEQLKPKENLPDLTKELDTLMTDEGIPPEEDSKAAEKAAPSIDDLVAEQLKPKEENLPDLTGDMDSLLAKGLPPEENAAAAAPAKPVETKSAPNLDALIAEQLADKAENLPDLTGDMDSLLAKGLPPEDTAPVAPAPAKSAEAPTKSAPNLDALIAEQLADKAENLPDLTGDMDSLLAKGLPPEEDNDILAQNPTSTLAELYISQGLPQKAVAVYKELLSRNPGDIELQAKLAIAQAKTSV